MLALIFSIVINVALLLTFFRFLMQLATIDPLNPVVQATFKATKAIDLFNTILPAVNKGRVNLAALVLLILLFLLKIYGLNHLGESVSIFEVEYKHLASSADGLLLGTLMAATDGMVQFCQMLIFAAILMSWVILLTQSQGPFVTVIQDLAEPLFAPFRRIVPNMGMIDLSPILAILALMIIEILMKAVADTILATFV